MPCRIIQKKREEYCATQYHEKETRRGLQSCKKSYTFLHLSFPQKKVENWNTLCKRNVILIVCGNNKHLTSFQQLLKLGSSQFDTRYIFPFLSGGLADMLITYIIFCLCMHPIFGKCIPDSSNYVDTLLLLEKSNVI